MAANLEKLVEDLSALTVIEAADLAKLLEEKINNIVGVVTVGLFANRGADILLLGSPSGVKTINK